MGRLYVYKLHVGYIATLHMENNFNLSARKTCLETYSKYKTVIYT